MTLKAVELSEQKWTRHLTVLRRSLVLLARLENGDKPGVLDEVIVRQTRRELRELVDLIEGVLHEDRTDGVCP